MINSESRKAQENAIVGCLLGTAIGDAMGLSYEGLSPQRLIKLYPKFNQYHLIMRLLNISKEKSLAPFILTQK